MLSVWSKEEYIKECLIYIGTSGPSLPLVIRSNKQNVDNWYWTVSYKSALCALLQICITVWTPILHVLFELKYPFHSQNFTFTTLGDDVETGWNSLASDKNIMNQFFGFMLLKVHTLVSSLTILFFMVEQINKTIWTICSWCSSGIS